MTRSFRDLLAVPLLVVAAPLFATTYTPTTFTDPPISGAGISVSATDGTITGGSGNGLRSLRSCVFAANAHAGADAITLLAGTYNLTIAPSLTSGAGSTHKTAYDSTSGALDIRDTLTVTGAGSGSTIIDGGSHDLIFNVNPYNSSTGQSANTAGFATGITGLKLQHGRNASDDGANGYNDGGAIWFDAGYNNAPSGTGTLSLTDVTFDSNATSQGYGGALIIWDGGATTITNCTFSNNTANGGATWAGAAGGAIAIPFNTGGPFVGPATVVITNTTFTNNNVVPFGAGGGDGGAIHMEGPWFVTIHGGSIDHNHSPFDAGGILNTHSVGTVTIDQAATINHNTAGTNGGGLEGTNLIVGAGVTITANTASTGDGGGIHAWTGSSITKATITNNSAGAAGGGVFFRNGPDASFGKAAPSVTLSYIEGNTATAGGSQVDSGNFLTTGTDDWLGKNVPDATALGATNAVAITDARGSGAGGTDVPGGTVTITTAVPHGFVSGQVVDVEGVGISTYDGPSGAGTGGITFVSATKFSYPSHLAPGNPGKAISSGGQAAETSSLKTASELGNVVTMTVDTYPHGLAIGQMVKIWDVSGAAGYNGIFKVTGVSGLQFTFTAPVTGLPSLSASRIGFAAPLPNNISAANESGSTVTLTTNGDYTAAPYGFAVGNVVAVNGVNAAGYNGVYVLTAVTASSVSYVCPTTGLASSSAGNVSKLATSMLQLKHTASPATIYTPSGPAPHAATLTAGFTSDSANTAIAAASLDRVVGLPITFGNAILGTLSGAQASIQATGTATATFTAGVSGGVGHADATVESQTTTADILIDAPPGVTSQPTNQSLCAGTAASFTAAASGYPAPTVQWQQSTDGGSTFTNIAGATAGTYIFTSMLSQNGYQYRAVFTNSSGTATSNAATLSVGTSPSVSLSPVPSTICAGSGTTFSVTASGANITYQWQVNAGAGFTDIANGGVYSNATTATLTITGATAAMNGYLYRCSVGGPCPPAAISNSAALTVNTAPSVSMQPSDTCALPATFTVGATGAAPTYQWQVNAGAGFVNVVDGGTNPTYAGATTTTLTITNPQPSMQGYTYRCVITGACSPPATSNAATLSVDTTNPVVTAPSAATVTQTLCQ